MQLYPYIKIYFKNIHFKLAFMQIFELIHMGGINEADVASTWKLSKIPQPVLVV